MKARVIRAALGIALAALLALGCAPSGGGGGSSKKKSSTGGSCADGAVISGKTLTNSDMLAGDTIGPGEIPQAGKVFLIGLPSVQADVNPDDGSFELTVPKADLNDDTGLACGEKAPLIAWWVADTFDEVAGVREGVKLSDTVDTGTLTLDWTKANHVTIVGLADGDTVTDVTFTGITDNALGVEMWRDPTLSNDFDTNYLPEGEYPIVVQTAGGTTLTGALPFDAPEAEAADNQWDQPTITMTEQ